MSDDAGDADDIEDRRRHGLALQANLPKPRFRPKDRDTGVIETGCMVGEAGELLPGPLGCLAAIAGTGVGLILWLQRRSKHSDP